MGSDNPNPQTALAGLTKELRKLLRDPLLRKPLPPLPRLTILTYNTRGLAPPKPNLILNFAAFLHIDLLILTETHVATPPPLYSLEAYGLHALIPQLELQSSPYPPASGSAP